MKATIEIPDELYRRVKAKSALEGQPVREVVMHLFRGWLGDGDALPAENPVGMRPESAPAWFGAARKYAQRVNRHDLATIRQSISLGRVHEAVQQLSEGRDP